MDLRLVDVIKYYFQFCNLLGISRKLLYYFLLIVLESIMGNSWVSVKDS